jgi:hypothetical protein
VRKNKRKGSEWYGHLMQMEETLPTEINNLVQTGNWKRRQPRKMWKGAQEMTGTT